MAKSIIGIVVFIFISNLILAQVTETNKNQITVLGSIELKEIADEASLYFTVKGVGNNLRSAVEEAERKTKIIADKLMLLGIKKNNISTSDFLSGENNEDKAFLSSSRDFKATIVTLIKTDSLNLLQPLLFTISESEVENISNITFSYKDEVKLKRRARIEAGLKAKEKAEDITKALGAKLGKVLLIEEVQSTYLNRGQFNNNSFLLSQKISNSFNPVTNITTSEAGIDETKGSGFFAQTISVTSQVRVVFSLE
jgi:uncharacterized protein